ncbi:MAG: serine hydrolase domain-containing protein [Bacteroidota bacterium]
MITEKGVVYHSAFGLKDRERQLPFATNTIMNIGSVSKTVVGLALVKAVEAGHLSMDTPINDVLPFSVNNPFFSDQPILIRHLANHTSGIRDSKHYGKTYVADPDIERSGDIHTDFQGFLQSHESLRLQDFLFRILNKKGQWYKKKNFLRAAPGTEADYANLNAALAALAIEHASGKDFESFCQEKIFIPLKMKHTSWDGSSLNQTRLATPYFPAGKVVPPYRLNSWPDGGLYTSVEDLSLLLQEIIMAFQGKSTFLSHPFAKQLLPGDDDGLRAFWGMGEKSRNIGHGGSDPGVQTDMQFNADRLLGRIIFTNVNAEDNEALWEQYRGIHRILAEYEMTVKD